MKISRATSSGETPRLLKHPKDSWTLIEGNLVVDSDNWLKETMRQLGFQDNTEVKQERLGEVYSTTQMVEFRASNKEAKVAVKKFKDLKSFKWAILNIWALPLRKFELTAEARMHREYTYYVRFREMGFNTPQIISLFLSERLLVTDFIHGINLGKIISDFLQGHYSDLTSVKLYGDLLARIHRSGYVVGDTKPSNTIYQKPLLYFTDLEQAGISGDASWDIAEFIYYAVRLCPHVEQARKFVETFKRGYLKEGSIDVLLKAANPKYLKPFQPFVLPKVSKAILEEITENVN